MKTKRYETDWTDEDRREFISTYQTEGVETLDEIEFIQKKMGFNADFVKGIYKFYREVKG